MPPKTLWLILPFLFLASHSSARQDSPQLDQPLSAELQARALADFSASPLHLQEPGDPKPGFGITDVDLNNNIRLRRGALYTPYLRFAELDAFARRAERRNPGKFSKLGAPELWVVIFPYSRERARKILGEESKWQGDPHAALDSSRASGNTIAWPKQVSLQVAGKNRRTIEPLWVRTDKVPAQLGLVDEWVAEKSIVAAFPLNDPAIAQRKVRIWVDYVVEGGARTTSDSSQFWLHSFTKKQWAIALEGKKAYKERKKQLK